MAEPCRKAEISRQCVACGCCVKVCPQIAIAVHNGIYAFVDEEKCIGCGKCAEECPAAVISITTGGVANDEIKAKAMV